MLFYYISAIVAVPVPFINPFSDSARCSFRESGTQVSHCSHYCCLVGFNNNFVIAPTPFSRIIDA